MPRSRRHHAEIHEEQRPVLYLESPTQLGVLDHRAVAHARVLPALTRETCLVALVQMLGKSLEDGRRGRHHQLNEGRLTTRSHHGDQAIDGRLPIMLETIEGA